MVFIVLKTARYVDPTEVIELGEILDLPRPRLRHHRAPRRGERAGRRCASGSRSDPELLQHGPGRRAPRDRRPRRRRLHARRSPGSARTSTRSRTRSSPAARTNPAERIYKLKREVLEFNRAAGPLVEPVDRLARGQYERDPPRGARLLPRRQRPPAARRTSSSRATATCSTSVLEANLAQVTCARTRTCARSRRCVAIVAVPTLIAGIYGMNFEHMPELELGARLPGVLAADGGIVGFLLLRAASSASAG